MEVIELAGSPRSMGEAFGETCREAIQGLYRARVDNAIAQARLYGLGAKPGGRSISETWLLRAAARCLPLVEAFYPPGVEELAGIARGSGLSLEEVWAMNALTDLRDLAAFGGLDLGGVPPEVDGCSSIVVHASSAEGGGAVAGQTWDLATDNMPFVRMVRRRPDDGPSTLCLTTTGCLSLIGLSSEGLAIGTTNLRTLDVRLGVCYLDVIHRALCASSFERAAEVIAHAPRAAAHYFYLLDRSGRIATFECSARRAVIRHLNEGFRVRCNHVIEPDIADLEAPGLPLASSHHRQARLTELALGRARLGPRDLRSFFEDDHGGPLAINRKDFAGISSNAAVILEPERGLLHAVQGPADEGRWIELSIG